RPRTYFPHSFRRRKVAGDVPFLNRSEDTPMRLDCIAVAALSLLNTAAAQEYEIDKDETVFAVVTHKGGIASALAHNHFIFPVQYEARVWQEGDAVESGRFRIEFPAAQLTPDVKEAEEKWY